MRLKFWEDSVEKIYDTKNIHIPDHPVVLEVKKIVDEFKLSKRYFQRLVNSRNRPSNSQFVTTKQLEDYSEQTVSSIYYLLLEQAGIKNVQADHAASHLGKSQGIVNILRLVFFYFVFFLGKTQIFFKLDQSHFRLVQLPFQYPKNF